jgi:hypothetical protein
VDEYPNGYLWSAKDSADLGEGLVLEIPEINRLPLAKPQRL